MNILRPLALAAASACFAVSVPLVAAPSVEEKVLGPANQGGIYTISAYGGHAAFSGNKGGKAQVIVDGVEGPVLDELFTIRQQSFTLPAQAGGSAADMGGFAGKIVTPVIFTDDGSHWAYSGRDGEEYVIYHDGKEVGRGKMENLALAAGPLTLSPTGRHVYWSEVRMVNGNSQWRILMTGKPSAWSGEQTLKPVFNSDDSHYAFNGGKIGDYRTKTLIIDGKEASYAGIQPTFLGDSDDVVSYREGEGKFLLLLNGKTIASGPGVDLLVSASKGKRWAATVRTKVVNGLYIPTLFVDGKEVAKSEGVQKVWFSPDGKHYAAMGTDPATRASYMIVDGKRSKDYAFVSPDPVLWTPDNDHSFYFAAGEGRQFLVVDGKEQPVERILGFRGITFAKEGDAYAYATADNTNQHYTVIQNGKNVLPDGLYPISDTLTFSPDGNSLAYFVCQIGRSEPFGIVVDGKVTTGLQPINFPKWYQMEVAPPALAVSPEGKYVAYLARGSGPASGGLYVNGTMIYRTTGAVYNPRFTKDGKHLMWAAQVKADVLGRQTPIAIYIDGVEVTRANGYFFNNVTGTVSMNDDDVITYLAADGNEVKRYRIKPSGDTDVASAISEFQKNEARALAEAEAARVKAEAEAEAARAAQAEAAETARRAQAAAAAQARLDAQAAQAAKTRARQEALEAKKRAAQEALEAKQRARAAKKAGQ